MKAERIVIYRLEVTPADLAALDAALEFALRKQDDKFLEFYGEGHTFLVALEKMLETLQPILQEVYSVGTEA